MCRDGCGLDDGFLLEMIIHDLQLGISGESGCGGEGVKGKVKEREQEWRPGGLGMGGPGLRRQGSELFYTTFTSLSWHLSCSTQGSCNSFRIWFATGI
jgi:hypothetical protein